MIVEPIGTAITLDNNEADLKNANHWKMAKSFYKSKERSSFLE